MKKIMVFFLGIMFLAVGAFAAENLFGLDQRGPNVFFKTVPGVTPHAVIDNSTTQTVQNSGFIQLFNTSALTVQLAGVKSGQFFMVTQADNGTAGHKVTLPSGMIFDVGTSANASIESDSLKFDAQYETVHFFVIDSTQAVVLTNSGSVTYE